MPNADLQERIASAADHRQHSNKQARKIVRELAEWVNDMGHDNGAFAQAVMEQHRTIQQQMFEVMLACIELWAQADQCDQRNEFTVKKSRDIMELFPGGASVPMI